MAMEENAINIDGRMFEAYDSWEEYAKERCLENPWDIEEEFTENIDKAAGSGTAVFVAKAIEIFVLQ